MAVFSTQEKVQKIAALASEPELEKRVWLHKYRRTQRDENIIFFSENIDYNIKTA